MFKKARKTSNSAGERGGFDLIQVLVALIIVGTAAVSATFSIFIGRGALDSEWRKKQALEMATDEMEYWTAFIFEGQGDIAVPDGLKYHTITRQDTLCFLDYEETQPILCTVVREPLQLNLSTFNLQGLEIYKIKVNVIWQEPSDNRNLAFPPDTVKLQSWIIYGNAFN